MCGEISARNQLKGKIIEVKKGGHYCPCSKPPHSSSAIRTAAAAQCPLL
jgi:hypothetical protein